MESVVSHFEAFWVLCGEGLHNQIAEAQRKIRRGIKTKEKLTGPLTRTMTAKLRAKSTISGKPIIRKRRWCSCSECPILITEWGSHKYIYLL